MKLVHKVKEFHVLNTKIYAIQSKISYIRLYLNIHTWARHHVDPTF